MSQRHISAYGLPFTAQFVTFPNSVTHVFQSPGRYTLCRKLIPVDGPRMSTYSETGRLFCDRCAAWLERREVYGG